GDSAGAEEHAGPGEPGEQQNEDDTTLGGGPDRESNFARRRQPSQAENPERIGPGQGKCAAEKNQGDREQFRVNSCRATEAEPLPYGSAKKCGRRKRLPHQSSAIPCTHMYCPRWGGRFRLTAAARPGNVSW